MFGIIDCINASLLELSFFTKKCNLTFKARQLGLKVTICALYKASSCTKLNSNILGTDYELNLITLIKHPLDAC